MTGGLLINQRYMGYIFMQVVIDQITIHFKPITQTVNRC